MKYLKTLNDGQTLWMSPFLPPKSMQGIISKDKNGFKTNYYLLWLVIASDVLSDGIIKLLCSTSKKRLFPNEKDIPFKNILVGDLVMFRYYQTYFSLLQDKNVQSRVPEIFPSQKNRTSHPGWILRVLRSQPRCPVLLTYSCISIRMSLNSSHRQITVLQIQAFQTAIKILQC